MLDPLLQLSLLNGQLLPTICSQWIQLKKLSLINFTLQSIVPRLPHLMRIMTTLYSNLLRWVGQCGPYSQLASIKFISLLASTFRSIQWYMYQQTQNLLCQLGWHMIAIQNNSQFQPMIWRLLMFIILMSLGFLQIPMTTRSHSHKVSPLHSFVWRFPQQSMYN